MKQRRSCLLGLLLSLHALAAGAQAEEEREPIPKGRYPHRLESYQRFELRDAEGRAQVRGVTLFVHWPLGEVSGTVDRMLLVGEAGQRWELVHTSEPTTGVYVARWSDVVSGRWVELSRLSELTDIDYDSWSTALLNLDPRPSQPHFSELRVRSGATCTGLLSDHLPDPPPGALESGLSKDGCSARLVQELPMGTLRHLRPLLTSLCPKPLQPGEESVPHFVYWSSLLCELKAALGIEQPLNPPWTVHTVGSLGLMQRSFSAEALELTTKFSHLAPTDPLPDAEVRRLLLEAREKGQRLRAEVAQAKLPGAADPP
jgi:hypothetical protein